jgi:hypothetical protein
MPPRRVWLGVEAVDAEIFQHRIADQAYPEDAIADGEHGHGGQPVTGVIRQSVGHHADLAGRDVHDAQAIADQVDDPLTVLPHLDTPRFPRAPHTLKRIQLAGRFVGIWREWSARCGNHSRPAGAATGIAAVGR